MNKEELFKSSEEYLMFLEENCGRCKKNTTIVYDYADGENKTKYLCKILREINDYLCEEKEPSQETRAICDFCVEHGGECPDKIDKNEKSE